MDSNWCYVFHCVCPVLRIFKIFKSDLTYSRSTQRLRSPAAVDCWFVSSAHLRIQSTTNQLLSAPSFFRPCHVSYRTDFGCAPRRTWSRIAQSLQLSCHVIITGSGLCRVSNMLLAAISLSLLSFNSIHCLSSTQSFLTSFLSTVPLFTSSSAPVTSRLLYIILRSSCSFAC